MLQMVRGDNGQQQWWWRMIPFSSSMALTFDEVLVYFNRCKWKRSEKEEDWALRDMIWWRFEWDTKVGRFRYGGGTRGGLGNAATLISWVFIDEDQWEKVTFYKNANARHGKEKKPVTHSYAKLYTAPLGQYGNHFRGQRTGGFQPASGGLHPTGGSSQLVNRCLSLLVEVAVVVLLLHLLRHPVVLSVVGLVILLMSAQIVMWLVSIVEVRATSVPVAHIWGGRRWLEVWITRTDDQGPQGECFLLVVLMLHSRMISFKVCVS